MTTRTYEFTAFSEDDLVQQGTIGGGLGDGETFVMPAAATTTISTRDDDSVLSGDHGKDKDDKAKDSSGQIAMVDGVEIPGKQVYVEKYFVLKGSDGKTYYLAEIEIENYDAPGSGDDFFTFIGDVPPAGTSLKTIDKCNVKDGIAYADLGAGALEGDTPADCITIEAEDMQDHGFRTVHGDQASGGELVKIEGHDGSLSTTFNGPSAVYDLSIYAQDETDGVSKLRVFVDGEQVGTIMLDQQSNGGGSDNSGFTAFTLEGLAIPDGAEIEIQAWKDSGEWVRIDKLELKKVDELPENEAPSFDNLPDNGVLHIDENETFVVDIDASDADGDSLTYEIVGGRDGDMFTIDATTGELSFKAAQDYENPNSGGNNNTYDVTVKVSDGNGGEEVKPLWVKVKDVDEADPICIVVEAEDMHLCGYSVEHNGDASGGANIKATGQYGIAETVFSGPDGTYDLSVFSMDENDGNGAIDVFVNGEYVDTIWLDQGNDGGGGANTGSTFSEDTFQDLMLQTGDVISLVGYTNCSEFARIDKIVLCQDGDTCPPEFMKLDFSGLTKGTTVSNQFDGVTITAQKSGDGANSANDAMIFDSNNTTGGDGDLGFDGLGNILIISEDNDASDPDDNAGGGSITFDFDAPSDLHDIKLLDIEEHGGTIDLFDDSGALIKSVAIPAAGNNSIQTIALDAADVASMQINLVGSGAVDDLCWNPGEPQQELGSLAGRYFCDENDDSLDNSEPGIVGATVELLDAAGNVIADTTTDANGDYLFTDLAPGTYSVRFAPDTDGKTFVDPNAGDDAVDSDVNPNTGQTDPIMLGAGENKTDVDAGVEDPGTAALKGRYFCDENDNDVDDAEPGIGGVTVTLLTAAGVFVADTVTAADGTYEFLGLDAGDYKVAFDADPTGKTFVAQDQGNDNTVDSDVNPNTGETGVISVAIGDVVEDIDAGVEDPGTASVGDTVWFDANGDGILNGTEAGVAGVNVTLTGAGADGVLGTADDTTATTATNAAGAYLFDGLDAGSYKVTFDASTTGGLVFTTEGADADDAVNNDSDADQATGMTEAFDLSIGEAERDIDAGLVDPGTASLGGRYFCDENDNDVDDAEPAISGVEVFLLDAAGNVVDSQLTNGNGDYLFTDLDAGTYSVRFDADPSGKTFVAQDQGSDETVDSDVNPNTGETGPIQVNIGDAIRNVDAGVEDPGTAALKGRYFCDENDNDVDDAEPGIGGVTVTLLTAAGVFVADTVTAADGTYEFLGLDAGDYKVAFDADPAGKTFVAQDQGNDNTVDSDVNPNTGETGVISVAIGDVVEDIDAGVEDPGTASLGDKVFLDLNGNGVQDAGEEGVADVTVLLLDENGAQIDSTTTDDMGMYLFGDLDAGTYIVDFVEPDGFDFTVQDADPDDAIDSDADPSTGQTGPVTLEIGEENLTLDAGLIVENDAPNPEDDAGMICANELLTLDVLDNDSDPDGDTLSVTAVNGVAIGQGDTINIDGVFVTLDGGALTFDGEMAFIDLDIGEKADVQYTYTVSDGMGGFSDAFIDVAYCGTAEDLADIAASLPVQVNYQIIDEAAAGTTDGFTIQITGSGDARLDDIVFEAAYCASAFDPADGGTDFSNAPLLTGDLYVAEASLLPDNVLAGQTGINGESAEDNLDLINWILNQDFQGQGYTDFEVQGAIWSLTDSIDFIRPDLGELEDVREIVALAEANGEGFVAGEGDVVGLMIDPNPASSTNSQPFIIGIDFNDIDCLC